MIDYTAAGAQELATLLPQAGVKLPAGVAAAITGYQRTSVTAAPAAPPPGVRAQKAIADTAWQAARQAAEDGAEVTLDLTAIRAARQAEADDSDLAALAKAIREAGARLLCGAADEHHAELIDAIQAKWGEAVAKFHGRARRLPPGVDDQVALAEGGRIRSDYLAARDEHASLMALRAALALVDEPWPEVPDSFERAFLSLRTDLLVRDLGRFGDDPGSFGWYLAACQQTEPADLWLPTVAQVRERAAEFVAGERAQRAAQMERMPALPARPAW
jgi:hypothetical protein